MKIREGAKLDQGAALAAYAHDKVQNVKPTPNEEPQLAGILNILSRPKRLAAR